MEGERTKLQKAILWILLAMAVIFAVVTLVVRQTPGVLFEETLLTIAREGERTVYSGKKHGDAITIVAYPEGAGHVVELTIGDSVDQRYRVDYPGGTITGEYGETFDRITITCNGKILFDGGYNPAAFWSGYCDMNGETKSTTRIRAYSPGDPWYGYELYFSEVVDFATGPDTTTRGSWAFYGLGLFLSVICAVGTAFPRTLFYIQHALSVKDPEPTDFYLRAQEVSGVIVAVGIFIVYMVGVNKIV